MEIKKNGNIKFCYKDNNILNIDKLYDLDVDNEVYMLKNLCS